MDFGVFYFVMGFGFSLTVWLLGVVALPLFYGIPRTLYWAVKGWVKVRAALFYLVAPLTWSLVFIGLALGLAVVFPGAFTYLRDSAAFGLGQSAAVLFLVGRLVFSRSTRLDANKDFTEFVAPFLTETGRTLLVSKSDAGEENAAILGRSTSPANQENPSVLVSRIRALLTEGRSLHEIALVLGVTVAMVDKVARDLESGES